MEKEKLSTLERAVLVPISKKSVFRFYEVCSEPGFYFKQTGSESGGSLKFGLQGWESCVNNYSP